MAQRKDSNSNIRENKQRAQRPSGQPTDSVPKEINLAPVRLHTVHLSTILSKACQEHVTLVAKNRCLLSHLVFSIYFYRPIFFPEDN